MPPIKYRARTETGDPDPVDLYVGSRLHLRRTLLGLSQNELAQATNVTFQQVQKYETGFNRISASRLYHIAAALDIPISFFFDGLPGQVQTESSWPTPTDTPCTRETLGIMRNYHRIHDPAIRRDLCHLVRTLAMRHD